MTLWENALIVAGAVFAYVVGRQHGYRVGRAHVIARSKGKGTP
jgi:hypothetical protein